MLADQHHGFTCIDTADRCILALCVQDLHWLEDRFAVLHDVDDGPACALDDAGLRQHHCILECAHGLRDLDKGAGPELARRVGEDRLDFDRAGVGVDRVVDKLQVPGEALTVLAQRCRHLGATVLERCQCVAQVALRNAEGHGNRIELCDRHQRCHIGLHCVAGRDCHAAGTPRVRCHDAGVREGNARCVDGGLIGSHHGQLRIELCLAGVERALRDEVLRQQLLCPCPLPLRIGQCRIVFGQLRLRLGNIGLVGARIEREEQLAGLDKLTVFDVHLADDVRDLGAHINAGQRCDGCGGFEQHAHITFECAHRADGDGRAGARCGDGWRAGRRGRCCSIAFATATKQCSCDQATNQRE